MTGKSYQKESISETPTAPSDSKVHALVLGSTLLRLRERKGLRQAQLAATTSMVAATLSRIETGRLRADAHVLHKLLCALGVDQTAFMRLVEEAMARSGRAAAQTITLGRTPWWQMVERKAGRAGLAALVVYAVSVTLAESGA